MRTGGEVGLADAAAMDGMGDGGTAPLYRQVKAHVLDLIATGALKPGDRVPSEHELVSALGVSRMTANRALRELTAEGRLTRTAGVGTFVAERRPVGAMLAIRNIADEIRERGGAHSADPLHLAAEALPPDLASRFDLPVGTVLFHSLLLHREDGRPLQLEDRWVLPDAAPDYLSLDFRTVTPSQHLLEVAPVQEVEHLVEAVIPDARTARLLDMAAGEPCLKLSRRTWIDGVAGRGGRVASLAVFLYPAGRYRLGGRFRPV